MNIEPIDLKRIKPHDNVSTLMSMEIGDSIFSTDAKKAESWAVVISVIGESPTWARTFFSVWR